MSTTLVAKHTVWVWVLLKSKDINLEALYLDWWKLCGNVRSLVIFALLLEMGNSSVSLLGLPVSWDTQANKDKFVYAKKHLVKPQQSEISLH